MFDLKTAKKLFFDKSAVADPAAKARDRLLSKFGAFVRQRSRTSIRKRKGTSRPGSPPFSHEGSLRRLILFARDPARASVVVGPVPFAKGEAPQLLEYGGTVVRRLKSGKTVTHHYRPRPFMRPAFLAELGRLPKSLKDMIK